MSTVNKQIISRLVPVTIFFLTIYTVLPFLNYGLPFVGKLNNTTLWWGISIMILAVFFLSRIYFFDKRNEDNMLIVWVYLIWNAVCIVRGMFAAEHYWDLKGLILNAMTLMLPIVMFSATNKMIVQSLISFYIKYTLPFFVLFVIVSSSTASGFYLMPISLLTLFLPAFTKRQKIFILAIIVLVVITDFGTRSNVLKFSIPLLFMLIYYLRNIISIKLFETARLTLFIIPLLFFILGVTGTFNIFSIDEYLEGEYTFSNTDSMGRTIEESVAADTRTFIYVEVLESAINNNYWLFGRTPARGNDSYTFGLEASELTGRNERLANEIGLSNVFTWTGLVGVILYSMIFLRASYLAVNKSRNIFIKIMGLFVAFRWLYSWVEDINNFSLNYFMLMIAIGMCFSISFRKMSNNEFIIWLRGIFDIRYVQLQKYLLNENENEKAESRRIINVPQQEK